MKLLIRCSILFLFVHTQSVLAGACADDIDCDCNSIPNDPLKMSCMAHERMLKDSCVKQKQGGQAYCAQHGPAGFPVATAITLDGQSASENVDDSNRMIAQLYWSIRQDALLSEEAYRENDLEKAAVILRISKRNLDSLFNTQRAVDKAISAQQDAVVSAWSSYSADTFALAEHWNKYLLKVQKVEGKDKLHTPLAELVGYIYEQAGYAYARATKYAAAAQAWKSASSISAKLLSATVSGSGQKQEVDKYTSLTAARLHRASLYWVQSNGDEDPELLARKAAEFASDKLLREILADAKPDR